MSAPAFDSAQARATHALPESARAALDALVRQLQEIFGDRLRFVVAYGIRAPEDEEEHALALVDRVTFDDLAACAPLVAGWRRRGLAAPLILTRDEFNRTLDVFPLEWGEIIAHHVVVFGVDPFAGVKVPAADLRRACEHQAKSHLIHLREGFLETAGQPPAVARLIAASVPAFRALLDNIARLEQGQSAAHAEDDDESVASRAERQMGIPAAVVREVLASARGGLSTIVEPTLLFSRYLGATERIWQYVDAWRR